MNTLKILHRIYFNFNGKPDPYQDYLKTWEEELPNYKIMHWNENNLPMDICDYTKKLFVEKDHAFLSDYFRWWVLREYGGIYLDTDMEIINGEKFDSLVEKLENTTEYHSFIGIESVAAGYTAQAIACKKSSPFTQFMCSLYENMGFLYHLRKKKELLSPQLTQLYFYDKGFIENFGVSDSTIPVIIEKVMVYPQEYFSPLDYVNHAPVLNMTNLENTCLCHHFSGSWLGKSTNEKKLMFADYVKNREDQNLQQDYQNLQQDYQNLQQDCQNLQQDNQSLQQNKWYNFGQLSRKQKIKKIIVVFSKKLKIYPVLKYVYKTVRK